MDGFTLREMRELTRAPAIRMRWWLKLMPCCVCGFVKGPHLNINVCKERKRLAAMEEANRKQLIGLAWGDG